MAASSEACPAQEAMLEDLPSEADVELDAPAQHQMMMDGKHGAPYMSLVGSNAGYLKPSSSDNLYSKCVCISCGMGEVLGPVAIGGSTLLFCCVGHAICGMDGNCPQADAYCKLYNPEGDCEFLFKLLCCKLGLTCPSKPYVVINKKDMLG
mmetsp:Transcript_50693/g.130615  ORF Transcript_50693/g.130615 Transcript_50693/m.130615 type:complete len:151 (-) Transcript_50693:248-700(-)